MSARLPLSVDYSGLTTHAIGRAGIGDDELARLADKARDAVRATGKLRSTGEVGFFDLPDQTETARRAMDYARGLPPEVDTMVILGIGGSSLGPQAIYSALAPPFDPARPRSPGMPRRLFFADNSDPVTFRALLDLCPLSRTVFHVITKSGGTSETAAQLLVVYDWIRKRGGEDAIKRHLIVTTDPKSGPLREMATRLGLTSFEVPSSVGGRFSVLSAVGLVPAAVAGLDVVGLLDGARAMRDAVCAEEDLYQNPALMLAALLYLHHTAKNRPMVVLMPYVDALYSSADWFRQLWAESLGKTDAIGPTPIAARGATDQHSQLQLYAEGPADKVFLFLSARERGVEVAMPPSPIGEHPAYGYLVGRGMGELLDAELLGTQASLARRGRPTGRITLERVDAAGLGALFMLFEAATAFAGPLYGVNPYDQPGVEEAKRLAFAALGRSGYDEERRILETGAVSDARYRF